MDYVDLLRAEARNGHASFHEFALSLSRLPSDCVFFFFEGEDDPSFYIRFASAHLGEREYREHNCAGKASVLKAYELVRQDGRALDRALFFVDRDHSRFLGEAAAPRDVFETEPYSFENYLVCERVFRRYWAEHLHLSVDDPRFGTWLKKFRSAHADFVGRMRFMMAAVLIGRGIDGQKPIKLNLNNANLDNVFVVDAEAGKAAWRPDGVMKFLASVNLSRDVCSYRAARKIARDLLSGDPKSYVRGKYELWFFVKFLQGLTRLLADRQLAKTQKLARATPKEDLTQSGAVHALGSLTPLPAPLGDYLIRRVV